MADKDVTRAQAREVRRMANSKGITSERFQRVGFEGPGAVIPTALEAIRRGRAVVMGKLFPTYDPATGIYHFDVDNTKSLGEMIVEGCYDSFYQDFTSERFQLSKGEGFTEFEAKIFGLGPLTFGELDHIIVSDDRQRPWLFSGIVPLLAFGSAFPEVQRQGEVVGFGTLTTSVIPPCGFPYLGGNYARRTLGVTFNTGLNGYQRALGVRPALPTT